MPCTRETDGCVPRVCTELRRTKRLEDEKPVFDDEGGGTNSVDANSPNAKPLSLSDIDKILEQFKNKQEEGQSKSSLKNFGGIIGFFVTISIIFNYIN